MITIDEETLRALNEKYDAKHPQEILRGLLLDVFPGEITLVSSFGTESAALLHMGSQIDRGIDVVFIDSGKLFGETLRYRSQLIEKLGLLNVRTLMPKAALLSASDPKGVLWADNADRCCFVRKVEPMTRALKDVNVWISGRKGFHGGKRSSLPIFELNDGRIKVNPLARWSAQDIATYYVNHNLPRHPLEADGYKSVGCMPCTVPVSSGTDVRAGRWQGQGKSECGIHISRMGVRKLQPSLARDLSRTA